MQFDSGIYKRVYDTELGQAIWRFIQEPDIMIRLERAGELGQPALKGMGQRFLDRFGNAVRDDFVKQMIGRMVRQLMEHRGQVFVRANQPFRNDPLFASSARYAPE